MKNINKKNIVMIIVSVLILGLFFTIGTFAYWQWMSSDDQKKTVSFSSGDISDYIEYDEGESKFVGDFKVGNSYLDGVHTTISINKTEDADKLDLFATINMDINEIGDTMRDSSAVKWTVTEGNSNNPGTVLGSGNFLNTSSGDTIALCSDIEVTTEKKEYTIWIWVDIAENPSSELTGEKLDTIVWTQVDQVTSSMFKVTKINSVYQKISATVVNVSYDIMQYQITTSDVEPTSWQDIASSEQGNKYLLEYTAPSSGTYYVWFKDSNGTVVSSSVEVETAKPVTITFNSSNLIYGFNDTSSPVVSGRDNEYYAEYSIKDKVITLEAYAIDNYIVSSTDEIKTNVKVYLEANESYLFSASCNGTEYNSSSACMISFVDEDGNYAYPSGNTIQSNQSGFYSLVISGEVGIEPTDSIITTISDVRVEREVTYTEYDNGNQIFQGDSLGSLLTMANNEFIKDGYILDGWYIGLDGTGSKVSASTVILNDVTYYAQWTVNTYVVNVEHYKDGAKFEDVNYQVEYGTQYSPPVETVTGYVAKTFAWYYFYDDGSSELIGNGTIGTDTVTITRDMTINIYYQPNTYTLTANANGGTIPATSEWTIASGSATATKNITSDSVYGTLPTPTRTGYTFNGWFTASSGGTQVSEFTVTGDTNQTIYAQWIDAAAPSVSLVAQDATNLKLFATDNEGIVGYYFGTTNPGVGGVSYNYDDPIDSLKQMSVQPIANVEYTPVSSTKNWEITVTVTEAGTHYFSVIDAIGNVKTDTIDVFTITYNVNGGGGAPSSELKLYGGALSVSNVIPSKEGYTFKGWSTSSTATTGSYTGGNDFTINENKTLYAVWEGNEYTVKFDYENNIYNQDTSSWGFSGGSLINNNYSYNDTTGLEVYSDSTLYTGVYMNLNSDKKTNTDYELSMMAYRTVDISGNLRAYATSLDSSGNVLSWNHGININSTTLPVGSWKEFSYLFNSGAYASWNAMYIDYDTANQGPVFISDIRLDEYTTISKTFGTAYGTLPTPTRTGYTFKGWYTAPNGGGTQVTSSSTVSIASNHTLFAHWTSLLPTYTYTGSHQLINDGNGNWRIKFYESGTLKVTNWGSGASGIDVFLVGGGGAGGSAPATGTGGGGGGGGYTKTVKNVSVSTTSYDIIVGAGGTPNAGRGGTSSAFNLSAEGGYGGSNGHGGNGGSGGGGGGETGYGGGYRWYEKGGDGGSNGASGSQGAGGGSAGGQYVKRVGGTGQGTTTYEFGESGSMLYSGGGGGGAGAYSSYISNPGAGGHYGGAGGTHDGGAGTPNTGGGGGGGGFNNGGAGGSGIVIIRNKR